MKRRTAAVVLAGVLLAACAGGAGLSEDGRVEGIVVEMTGDLESVEDFSILDAEGTSWTFVPAEGLTFHDGPLSHLSAHVTSGEPVLVEYERAPGGELVAVAVEDA